MVQTQSVGLILGVVGLDEFVVLLEDGESCLLLRASVGSVVFDFPGSPGSLDWSLESEESEFSGVSAENTEGSNKGDESDSTDEDGLLGDSSRG